MQRRRASHGRSDAAAAAGVRAVLALLCLVPAACHAPPAPARPVIARGADAIEQPTVAQALRRLPEFSKLTAMLRDTGVIGTLAARSPVTLLAPRDTAIAQIAPDARAALLDPVNGAALARSLRGLIIARAYRAEELRTLIRDGGGTARATTTAGTGVTFTVAGDEVVVTTAAGAKATMGTTEIGAGNGSIYVLDQWIG